MLILDQQSLKQVQLTLRSSKPCIKTDLSPNNSGYSATARNGTHRGAHVWAYIDAYGEIPEGKQILHYCDNTWCIEPTHLFAGTRSDNMRDMHKKGRGKNQKLSQQDVRDIREMAKNHSATYIAGIYNIRVGHAFDVITRRIWKHI